MRLNIGGICPAIPPKPKARFAIPCTWFPSKCANPAPGTRSAFEDDLSQLGVKIGSLRIQLELPSNEAVRAAVEAGLGATAISASVAAPSLEAGLLQQVAFRLPEREFHVLQHRSAIAAAPQPRC